MRPNVAFVTGIGVGAGLMFLLDPDRGARRRALVRDKVARALHETEDTLGGTARHLRLRARGVAATLRSVRDRAPVADDVLAARVRAKLGRVVSHSRAIHVKVEDGAVTLEGPILTAERAKLLAAVASVRGVRRTDDRLEAHDEPGRIPALQGTARS